MPRRKDESLECLFQENAAKLLAFAHRRIGVHDAEDLVQDAFLRMATASPEQPVENAKAYLYRISANLIVDHLRQRQRRLAVEGQEEEGAEVHDPAPGPDRQVFSRQQIDRLKMALAELPPRCRQVFILSKFKHLTYGEVATQLGISESTVEKHMIKALAHCKRRVHDVDE